MGMVHQITELIFVGEETPFETLIWSDEVTERNNTFGYWRIYKCQTDA